MKTEILKAYKIGFADGIRMAVHFIEGISKEEMNGLEQSVLVRMIKRNISELHPGKITIEVSDEN